jgi:hypothetical protein
VCILADLTNISYRVIIQITRIGIKKERSKPVNENINLSEWYNPTEAAAVISRNSGKVVRPDYVRKLAQYGKIKKLKVSDRASLYWKADVDKILVEERGEKSARAKKQKAAKKKLDQDAA